MIGNDLRLFCTLHLLKTAKFKISTSNLCQPCHEDQNTDYINETNYDTGYCETLSLIALRMPVNFTKAPIPENDGHYAKWNT